MPAVLPPGVPLWPQLTPGIVQGCHLRRFAVISWGIVKSHVRASLPQLLSSLDRQAPLLLTQMTNDGDGGGGGVGGRYDNNNEAETKDHIMYASSQWEATLHCSVDSYWLVGYTTCFSVVVCLRCLLHHILSLIAYIFRENREFVFIIIVQFMMSTNSRIRFGLQIVFVCLYITPYHYRHCANLTEDIELIKCLSQIFCRVCE